MHRPIARLEHGENPERGRDARRLTPRSSHAEWAPGAEREDPVAILRRQAETRVQELLPIRYGRMAAFAVHLLPRGRRGDGR